MKMYANLQQGESLPSFMQYLSVDLSKKSCMTEEVALNCLVMAYEHRAARYLSIYYVPVGLCQILIRFASVIQYEQIMYDTCVCRYTYTYVYL